MLLFALLFPTAVQASPLDQLSQLMPPEAIVEHAQSPVAGFTTVILDDLQVLYVSNDGRWLFSGPLIDLQSRANLSQAAQATTRLNLQRNAPTPSFDFPAPQQRYQVTVITDIDCTYCRQLHAQMPGFHELGIGIRYLMAPRSGLHSAAYNKAVAAACSTDPNLAITQAMAGEPIKSQADCDHTIDAQFAFARALGANGTPNILLPNGELIGGMQTPSQLVSRLAQLDEDGH